MTHVFKHLTKPLQPLFLAENCYHGMQLVAAVVLAYGGSRVLGLSETFWAVMTSLIVMRPNTASTLDAALSRIGSTILGAVAGLAGIYLISHGVNVIGITLGVVAILAYVGAAQSNLRGAPVAALIVLSAASSGEHFALQVALLRIAQVGVGIATATTVSLALARYQASHRTRLGCAKLLRGAAARLASRTKTPSGVPGNHDPDTTRSILARLMTLAKSVDRTSRIFARAKPEDRQGYQQIVMLTAQTLQDISVLGRTLVAGHQHMDQNYLTEIIAAVVAALRNIADLVEGTPSDLRSLRNLYDLHVVNIAGEDSRRAVNALLASPLLLLHNDLHRLSQWR